MINSTYYKCENCGRIIGSRCRHSHNPKCIDPNSAYNTVKDLFTFPGTSYTRKEIEELTGLSHTTVYDQLNKLLILGFIHHPFVRHTHKKGMPPKLWRRA